MMYKAIYMWVAYSGTTDEVQSAFHEWVRTRLFPTFGEIVNIEERFGNKMAFFEFEIMKGGINDLGLKLIYNTITDWVLTQPITLYDLAEMVEPENTSK